MSQRKPARVLPADVYDRIEASAERYGGIGAGKYWNDENDSSVPYCVYGHIKRIGVPGVYAAFEEERIDTLENDDAVRAINDRRPFWRRLVSSRNARVPFADWCAEIGVERGSS